MVDNFYAAISEKTLSEDVNLATVNDWIAKYPAFHSAYLLKGFLLNKKSADAFQNESPKIAVNVLDRAKLFDMVQKDTEWAVVEKKKVEEPVSIVLDDSIGIEWVTDESQENDFDKEIEEILDNAIALDNIDVPIESKGQVAITDSVKWINEDLDEGVVEEENLVAEKKIAEKGIEGEFVVEKTVEEQVEIDEPVLEKTPLSYTEWLQQKKKAKQEAEEIAVQEEDVPAIAFEMPSQVEAELMLEGQRSKDKLEGFISTQIQKKRRNKQSEDVTLVSETLAEILLLQKKYNEAIKTYQALSLKYPQKSTYFARQIEKIKKQL